MSTGCSPSIPIGLPADSFERVFPFFFAWDTDLKVTRRGASIAKICGDVVEGESITELFTMIRPHGGISVDYFQAHVEHLLLFKHLGTGAKFRGQVLQLAEQGVTVMLASPWLQDTAQMEELGLTFADFAIHDQALDLLQLLQTQQMANDDLKKLMERLTAQQARLRVQEAEARKLALNGMMGRAYREYLLPLFSQFRLLSVFKHDPAVPDSDVTPEYLVDHNWLVGSPRTVTQKLAQMQEETGGFGSMLVINFDFKDEYSAWSASQQALMEEVVPQFNRKAAA